MHKTIIMLLTLVVGYYAYKNNTFPQITAYVNEMLNLPKTVLHQLDDMTKSVKKV